jgi:hypothetical protein
MTETRLRGTDKGEVVSEAFVDGEWVIVPDASYRHAVDVQMLKIAEAVLLDVPSGKPRRGRPPKPAA